MLLLVGTCLQYYVVIVENSNSIPASNWNDVKTFLLNLITVIDENADLGNKDRLVVVVYASQSQTTMTLENLYTNEKLVHVVGQLSRNSSDSGASGLQQALIDATSMLVPYSGSTSAMIIFKYSATRDDQRQDTRQRLHDLVDRQVTTIVIGKNIACPNFNRLRFCTDLLFKPRDGQL